MRLGLPQESDWLIRDFLQSASTQRARRDVKSSRDRGRALFTIPWLWMEMIVIDYPRQKLTCWTHSCLAFRAIISTLQPFIATFCIMLSVLGQARPGKRCEMLLLPSDSPLSEQHQDPIFLFSPCIVICSSFPPHELSSSTLIPSLFCVFTHCSLTVITCFFALTWFGLHSCF